MIQYCILYVHNNYRYNNARQIGAKDLLTQAHLHRTVEKETGRMQSGTGIQELMAAETRASQIVAEARIGESRRDSMESKGRKKR